MVRTGRLARPMDEYPANVAAALLMHSEDALIEEIGRRKREAAWLYQPDAPPTVGGDAVKRPGGMRPPTGKRARDWATPRITGDPVADKWERAIARGEMPDF